MTDARANNPSLKMAVLIADAFQDSEYFLPKIEIEKMGVITEIVSLKTEPVTMWSFFDVLGTISVDKTIEQVNPDDYIGVLIPGGAKSPATLAQNSAVREFVATMDKQDKLIASICRGTLLVAQSGIVKDRNITGFCDSEQFPDLAIAPTVKELGGKWHDDKSVVIDNNLISSRHPDDANAFTNAIADWLEQHR